MTQVLTALLFLLGYCAFVLVKPDKACGRCSGWGFRRRRRRSSACGKCKGTGKRFRLGAPLVHRGKSMVIRYVRKRLEQRREAG